MDNMVGFIYRLMRFVSEHPERFKGFDMWCFIATSDDFTVFELTPEYVKAYGPYPAGTFKEALDGVLDVVRHAFAGFDVYVGIAHSSFDLHGTLCGVVEVRLPFEEEGI